MNSRSLNQLVDVFHKITDPRDPKGVRHDFHGMIILVFLGLLGQLPYIAWTYRWAKKYWHNPPRPARFQKNEAAGRDNHLACSGRVFARRTPNKCVTQSSERKVSILCALNSALCTRQYPMLELLTGDAIFAQRPLLEALQQHGRKYLFQLKENQGDAFEAVKYALSEPGEPEDVTFSKKKAVSKFANSGATSTMPLPPAQQHSIFATSEHPGLPNDFACGSRGVRLRAHASFA